MSGLPLHLFFLPKEIIEISFQEIKKENVSTLCGDLKGLFAILRNAKQSQFKTSQEQGCMEIFLPREE